MTINDCPASVSVGGKAYSRIEKLGPNQGNAGARCEYAGTQAKLSVLWVLDETNPLRLCKRPVPSPGFLNSQQREIQVFVPTWVDDDDKVRQDFLETLEKAAIGLPCLAKK